MVGNGLHGVSFIVAGLKELLLGNGIGELGIGEMVGICKENPIVAIHSRIQTSVRESVNLLNLKKKKLIM